MNPIRVFPRRTISCANDFIAIDTLQVFKKLGISVPSDVYLCGFDDSPESRIMSPTLTTIHIHSQIMGFTIKHSGKRCRTVW